MKVTTIKTKWNETDFKQNTHVIESEIGYIIVDAGAPVEEVKKITEGKPVFGVLITHCHYDHILHIEKYQNEFESPIFLSEYGNSFMSDETLNCSKQLAFPMNFKISNGVPLKGGEVFKLENFAVYCLHTPGHSDDSMCFFVKDIYKNDAPILFTGDTVFEKKLGKTEFPTGDRQTLIESLYTLINFNFDGVYTGHARNTTKQELIENLPILLEEQQSQKI